MLDDSVFARIKHEADQCLRHSHHDKTHVQRVYKLAMRLAEEEHGDVDVVKASALLHDIARAMEDEGKIADHAVESARMAKEILDRVGFPPEKIARVVHCIEAHRFKKGMRTLSLEAQILQDADRLDILGAIGIARVFARGGWSNMPLYDPEVPPKRKYDGKSLSSINHIYEKILKVKDTINTERAKEIAEERHEFVVQFLDRFLREWKGDI